MIQNAIDRRNDQERRILLKTQDQQLVHRAVHGAGLSPWEAEVLVETVEEVYFAQGPTQTIRAGQMRYECVAADEPPGKMLSDCRLIGVVLTVLHRDDPFRDTLDVRQQRICRLCEKAREQDGLLSRSRSRPCAVGGIIPAVAGTLRRSHARDENSVGRADLLAGIEKQAGPR